MAPEARPPDLFGGLTMRPLRAEDAPELTRIHQTPEVSRWWADPEPGFPWDEPESTRWTVELDGSVVGLIQFSEETEPRYRHAAIDMFLDPAHHSRGLGTEVIRRITRHLVEKRGHHRITIDPAADNAAAIRCYEKAGFTAVGVMRSYERDAFGEAWHDGVLMELIARPGQPRQSRQPSQPGEPGEPGRPGRMG